MTTWLTLEEAAKRLKIGKSTIYRLAREGDLPAHRMGRVMALSLAEEILSEGKQKKWGRSTVLLPSLKNRYNPQPA